MAMAMVMVVFPRVLHKTLNRIFQNNGGGVDNIFVARQEYRPLYFDDDYNGAYIEIWETQNSNKFFVFKNHFFSPWPGVPYVW